MGLNSKYFRPRQHVESVKAFQTLVSAVVLRDADRKRPGALVEKMPKDVRGNLEHLTSDMIRHEGLQELAYWATRAEDDFRYSHQMGYMSKFDISQLKIQFDRTTLLRRRHGSR